MKILKLISNCARISNIYRRYFHLPGYAIPTYYSTLLPVVRGTSNTDVPFVLLFSVPIIQEQHAINY
jgi:hypothetical protein